MISVTISRLTSLLPQVFVSTNFDHSGNFKLKNSHVLVIPSILYRFSLKNITILIYASHKFSSNNDVVYYR